MDLEKKKKELEIKRVLLARDEMEFKIAEREADIMRLKDNIEIQNKRIEELNLEIKEEKE